MIVKIMVKSIVKTAGQFLTNSRSVLMHKVSLQGTHSKSPTTQGTKKITKKMMTKWVTEM